MLEERKTDHIRINLEEDVNFNRLTTGLENYHFLHQALPANRELRAALSVMLNNLGSAKLQQGRVAEARVDVDRRDIGDHGIANANIVGVNTRLVITAAPSKYGVRRRPKIGLRSAIRPTITWKGDRK